MCLCLLQSLSFNILLHQPSSWSDWLVGWLGRSTWSMNRYSFPYTSSACFCAYFDAWPSGYYHESSHLSRPTEWLPARSILVSYSQRKVRTLGEPVICYFRCLSRILSLLHWRESEVAGCVCLAAPLDDRVQAKKNLLDWGTRNKNDS